jgi:hypothetical protein
MHRIHRSPNPARLAPAAAAVRHGRRDRADPGVPLALAPAVLALAPGVSPAPD